MEDNEAKKKEEEIKVQAAIEVMEAYVSSKIQPTTYAAASKILSDFVAANKEKGLKVLRGGACLQCCFERRYYEALTDKEAEERFSKEHEQQHPECSGFFVPYEGLDED